MTRKLIEKGLKEHRAGRPESAKLLYEQALKLKPRDPDALHLAGVAALQCGEAARAAHWMERAVQVSPRNPAFHGNLAQAYCALERYADALAAFQRAAALDPREPQFAIGTATCVARLGNAPEAERILRDVLQRQPGSALACFNLARAVAEQGRPEEAVEFYRRAIELDSGFGDAYDGLGSLLHMLGRSDEAEETFRRRFALRPYSEEATCPLASLLISRGRFAEAAALCSDALASSPDSVELHLKLGAARVHAGRLSAALETYRSAVRLAPDHPRAGWGCGYMLVETGHVRAGLGWLDDVVARHPDAPEFRDSRSLIRLSVGDLQGGWDDYAWRDARRKFIAENPRLILADRLPESLAGRSICLLREQGIGDELFFLRFAMPLKTQGANITYQPNTKLAPLLARAGTFHRLIAMDEPPPAADALLLVGDLPRVLQQPACSPLPQRATSPRDGAAALADGFPLALRVFVPGMPPPLPLVALPDRVEVLRARLDEFGPPPYIGITWRAGTPPAEQRGATWALHKEIGLEAIGKALRDIGGTLIALQRHPAPGEIDRLAAHAGAPVHDLCVLNDDLEAMLALLTLLDDYIGVSNTNMHLRAGTGRAARVLVPRPAEWRWMTAGSESPWFPGFRVYRQGPDGGWDDAIATLRAHLLDRASA